MGKKWTEQEEQKIIDLRLQGLTALEVASLTNRTEASIKLRYSKLIKEGVITNKGNGRYDNITNDELLELVKLYRTNSAWLEAKELDTELPGPGIVNRRFGSWNNALALAGLTIKYGLKSDKQTILYLVRFIEEDFYKIGITQNEIKTRFKGYPKYEVLEYITFDSLKSARAVEKELLNKVQEYSYLPLYFGCGRGHHECFQLKHRIASLKDIERLS